MPHTPMTKFKYDWDKLKEELKLLEDEHKLAEKLFGKGSEAEMKIRTKIRFVELTMKNRVCELQYYDK